MQSVPFGAVASGFLSMLPTILLLGALESRLLRGRDWTEISLPSWLAKWDVSSIEAAAKAGLFGGPILGFWAAGHGFDGFLSISDTRFLFVSAVAGLLTWLGFTLLEVCEAKRAR